MWIAVDEFAVYNRDVYFATNPHKLEKIDNQGKKRGDTVVVIRRNVNQASSEQSYIDEIQWNGGTALVRESRRLSRFGLSHASVRTFRTR